MMSRQRMALFGGVFLVCLGVAAWPQEKSPNRVVTERLLAQIGFSSMIRGSFKVSPDGKRVAYGARKGGLFTGQELVVVDGTEGKSYDDILTLGWKRTASISPDSLHYLARTGNRYYVVEESIQ